MNICTESSRSQRQNKPVGASLFCPLLMKPVGWVKRGWLPSISSGPHFRAWQVAEELAVAVGSLSSIRAWSCGIQRWSYCLLSPRQLLPLQSVERLTVPKQVSFQSAFGLWCLTVSEHSDEAAPPPLELHQGPEKAAEMRRARRHGASYLKGAAGREMWHGNR